MNKLFYGDNLDVLRRFVRDESIDLCYIDPPFNSKRNYNQIYNNIGQEDRAQAQAFVDTWSWWGETEGAHRRDSLAEQYLEQILTNENGVQTAQSRNLIEGLLKVLGRGSLMSYLVSMTVRIAEIHRTLKNTGSFYLHCDPTASHYLKLVCDAIFVPQGGDYKNEITWKRTHAHGDSKRKFANISDIILFYAKTNQYVFNPQYLPYSQDYVDKYYRQVDENGRRYQLVSLRSPNPRPNLTYDYKGYKPHQNGWAVRRELMEKLDSEGRLYFPKDINGAIREKYYLDEMQGVIMSDNWTDIDPISAHAQERLGYPTQKPEALLERIIAASSNEGDTILDTFCGCGTSVVVAEKLRRNWIGIDITYQSIALVLKRLTDAFGAEIAERIELHGDPRDMESVDALVHKRDDRVRKEFEKWAVLKYSNNRAIINDKKGADKGIDGTAFLATGKDEYKPVMLSVKSGKVGAAFVRDLRGVIERENAAVGILISREEPTRPMIEEARAAGQFKSDYLPPIDRLQIVTVQQILGGERMNLPLVAEVAKRAQKAIDKSQIEMFGE